MTKKIEASVFYQLGRIDAELNAMREWTSSVSHRFSELKRALEEAGIVIPESEQDEARVENVTS